MTQQMYFLLTEATFQPCNQRKNQQFEFVDNFPVEQGSFHGYVRLSISVELSFSALNTCARLSSDPFHSRPILKDRAMKSMTSKMLKMRC